MEPEISKPSYYALIPANIRYDRDLPPNAKLLYGEITALCNSKGYCWATNDYFAELYDVSKTSVSKWISALIEKKHITSQIMYKEGTKEILHRYLSIVKYPIEEKFNTPIEEKFIDNTTILNNTENINSFSYEDFVFLTNTILKRKYKGCTKSRRQFQARIKQGYTMEDFQAAILSAMKKKQHIESNFEYLTPELITREDRLQYFLNSAAPGSQIKQSVHVDTPTIPKPPTIHL